MSNPIYSKKLIDKLNYDIKTNFPHLFFIDSDMHKTFEVVSRLVMLDRYSQKDINHLTLTQGDLVLCVIKDDPKFPTRGIGYIDKLDGDYVYIKLEPEYIGMCSDFVSEGIIRREINSVDKPLELFYEQICHRVANNLGQGETVETFQDFYNELSNLNLVPAGRILFGAGSKTAVTYFNCFVMPFIHDSRGGISIHRQKVMEIMSRGGGVGTNGSTLRPKNTLAKGVNGKSSGAVSWLHDLSELTHLVEQGGSRRGAQMIMLADWHPDVIEFIISKMQNPKILQFLINNLSDPDIVREAKNKLKFTQLQPKDIKINKKKFKMKNKNQNQIIKQLYKKAFQALKDQGTYSVNNPEFLSGANISVAITKEFMHAVEHDLDYQLRFPDIDNYSAGEKAAYDEKWDKIGDVREWERLGYTIKTHKKIRAKELWNL